MVCLQKAILPDVSMPCSEKMEKMIEARFHEKGRMHFNVGGAQANEDAIKVVRNYIFENI